MADGRRPLVSTVLLALLVLSPAAVAQQPQRFVQPPRGAAKTADRNPAALTEVLAAIDTCVGRLHPDIDIGYERIAARCPGLAGKLDASPWGGWLPRDWVRPGNDLSAAGLRELRELLARETASPALQASPEVASVAPILAELAASAGSESSGWQRVLAWIRGLAGRENAANGSEEEEVVGRIGGLQAAIETGASVALAAVVLLAVVIVGNELRIAGVARRLGKRLRDAARMRRTGAAGAVGDDPAHRSGGWESVCAAAPLQRARVLLELVIEQLTAENVLPPARGLTARELVRAARLPDDAQRRRLTELARVSEIVRYSAGGVDVATVSEVVEDGRLLLEGRGTDRA